MAEAAVVGAPDPVRGEVPVAYVVLEGGDGAARCWKRGAARSWRRSKFRARFMPWRSCRGTPWGRCRSIFLV